jgi:hypothetical protein
VSKTVGAGVERTFVSVPAPDLAQSGAGGRPGQGVYHTPTGRRPRVAVIASHYEVDFSEHYLAPYLAERGYGFLGWNTRFRGGGPWFSLSRALTDIAAGVGWLRREAGAEVVVLLGNSGGASLMAAYQATGPTSAPGADAFVSLNAHPGRPDVLTCWLDPSVTDESDPLSCDPDLDMFRAGQGPPYPPEFVVRYRAAQEARNHRITQWCQAELRRLIAAGVPDRVFAVSRTWADLRFADLTLDPSDRQPGCYAGDPAVANRGPWGLAAACSLRSWLEMWSLAESPCRAAPHLAALMVPALVVQSTADQGCFPSDARTIFGALGSADKSLEWRPGRHYFEDGGRPEVADLIAGWLADRF